MLVLIVSADAGVSVAVSDILDLVPSSSSLLSCDVLVRRIAISTLSAFLQKGYDVDNTMKRLKRD